MAKDQLVQLILTETVLYQNMESALNILVFINLILVAVGDANFWNTQAQQTLQDALGRNENKCIAKNVILFIGDGMDIVTSTAARILRGQLNGETGEEGSLAWDEFPYVALSKTYDVGVQVADSAPSATALMCGIKARDGTIGVDESIFRGDCAAMLASPESQVESLLVKANKAGKATGIVTTTRLTHATPAAAYAHCPDRDWEDNAQVPPEMTEEGCVDIARQLIERNSFINVILGGGRNNFLPNTTLDPEYGQEGKTGKRTDGRNLIDKWLEGKEGSSSQYVWNRTAFQQVDTSSTEYLLGIFEPSHMQYDVRRVNDSAGEPSIGEMVQKSIEILSKDENGFFLMVEGGRIDHAHHDGVASLALYDTLAFHEAVAKAQELTNEDDTLIIVTADHAHVMTMGGYPSRGNPIFGYDDRFNGSDDLPYLTLSYTNGPGGFKVQESYQQTGQRPNHYNTDYDALGFVQDATVPIYSETHGGSDVAVYALGPWAHLIHGTVEQHYVAHAVRYAACYSDGEDTACSHATGKPPACLGGGARITAHVQCVTIVLLNLILNIIAM